MKRDFLKTLNVEKPCAESWDEMRGDDKMRFCKHCAETVNNISEMTTREIEKLAAESNGKLCVRYIRNADKQIITKSTPQNFTPTVKRISQFAAGIFGAALSVSGVAAQTQTDANTNGNQPKIESKVDLNQQKAPGNSSIQGVVKDEKGAIIPSIKVVLSDMQQNVIEQVSTNGDGEYRFSNLGNGDYKLEFISDFLFEYYAIQNLQIRSESTINLSTELKVYTLRISTGLVVISPSRETTFSPTIYDKKVDDFFRAVQNGEIATIKKLLKNKNLIYARDLKGAGILASVNDEETAKFLIGKNADVNARDLRGQTALMWFSANDATEIIKVLLDAGADVNATSNFGVPPLMYAASKDNSEVVKVLIEHGANVNMSDVDGKTALLLSSYNGDLQSIKYLVEAGANVNSRDKERKSALAYALESNYKETEEIVNFLKKHGAVE